MRPGGGESRRKGAGHSAQPSCWISLISIQCRLWWWLSKTSRATVDPCSFVGSVFTSSTTTTYTGNPEVDGAQEITSTPGGPWTRSTGHWTEGQASGASTTQSSRIATGRHGRGAAPARSPVHASDSILAPGCSHEAAG